MSASASPSTSALRRPEGRDEVADGRPERGVRGGAGTAAEDDHEALGRWLRRAAGVEDVVGLLGLDRVLVRVAARVEAADAAHPSAQQEDADRDDEPQDRRPGTGGARSTWRP